MRVRIEPNSPLPIHVQLKEQIRFLILNGELGPLTKLPTARQLAGFLRINRNTVLKAYQELVKEGLIECRRGRGCVVVEQPVSVVQSISTRLLTIIDNAIDQAGALGVSPDDFATLAYARARQRQDVQVRRRLVFVECAARISAAFAQAIQERLDVEVTPIVLADLQQPTAEVEMLLREAHMVVTTFFHLQEVRKLLAGAKKRVIGLGLKPHLERLVQIATIPQGTPTAMICVSDCSAQNMKQSLENGGIKNLEASACGVEDRQKLVETLAGRSVVIVSDLVADEVRPLLRPGQELIVLDYLTLDEGGISLLRSLLEEMSEV
ncbi:MAG: GntR family transcriptional regulator [Anaerolineae bacterium]|jgi:GntR family transcriptional regulator|nr:GntR family transcriptional regulator [Anaerolineae bacterium]MDH7475115.1 GntR family transcriptional regulator [Anaerolineae bacterium]